MRSVSALDIMARWLAGSGAGIALLLVVPDDVFGPEPIIHFLSFLPTTRAHLIGLSVIVAAWVMFIVHLWQVRGGWCSKPSCVATIAVAVLADLVLVVGTVWGSDVLVIGGLVVAVLAQIVLVWHVDAYRARQHGPVPSRPRERVAADIMRS